MEHRIVGIDPVFFVLAGAVELHRSCIRYDLQQHGTSQGASWQLGQFINDKWPHLPRWPTEMFGHRWKISEKDMQGTEE